jgi:UPF0755 protein
MIKPLKRKLTYLLAIFTISALLLIWIFFGGTTYAPQKIFFYIRTGSDYATVKKELKAQGILRNTFFFDILSSAVSYQKHVKPGRYEIHEGMSLMQLVKKLKRGTQSEIRLVIKKVRTKEEFASLIGKHEFEVHAEEALQFLKDPKKLSPYGLDTTNVMTIIIPNSYLLYWNGGFEKIFNRLKKEHDLFWEGSRQNKAKNLGFTEKEIYIIASIVEEETTKTEDKPKIASVYINRLRKGMKLEADPTVKFAMRNFGLTRILHEHLTTPSPYNTYFVKGLPPGPICTPSISSIDAVLNASDTDFLFFVAKPDFSGYSNFTGDYNQHLKNAHAYQDALDKLQQKQK